MANPFSFRKEPPCCCGCRDLLQEAVEKLRIAANHLGNINTSAALIGNQGGVIQQLSEFNESAKKILGTQRQILESIEALLKLLAARPEKLSISWNKPQSTKET